MTTTDLRRVVAREWLILVLCLVTTVVAGLPPFIGIHMDAAGWAFVVGPYLVVQLARSMAWAFREIKRPRPSP